MVTVPKARRGAHESEARARSGTSQYLVGDGRATPSIAKGIRPWQGTARSLCEKLIEEPAKEWLPIDLATSCFCNEGKTLELLNQLSRLGAAKLVWKQRLLTKEDRHVPLNAMYDCRVRLTENGEDTIRSLINAGRPTSVIGTLLWEGRENAVAQWRYKRHEKTWRRSYRR